jgi:hypothetical protein
MMAGAWLLAYDNGNSNQTLFSTDWWDWHTGEEKPLLYFSHDSSPKI